MEVEMDTFRGLAIMLLTIVAYMIIDSLFSVRLLTFMLCAGSGVLTVFVCRNIKRSELNTFRATLALGIIFLALGSVIILKNQAEAYYDQTTLYIVTIGFFLSAIGMIVIFSSMPLIVYKDLELQFQKNKTNASAP